MCIFKELQSVLTSFGNMYEREMLFGIILDMFPFKVWGRLILPVHKCVKFNILFCFVSLCFSFKSLCSKYLKL